MKPKKSTFSILLSLCIALGTLHAQNTIFVRTNTGIVSDYLISSLRSFSFPSGSLQINKLDGTNNLFLKSNINKLFFGVVGLTNLKNIEPGSSKIYLYPNPVLNQLHIEYLCENSNHAEIIISDLHGKVLISKEITNCVGINIQTIDVTSLSRGIYLCRFNAGVKTEIYKFIK